jgi:formylglycine-generating enzyme required for sulfatase activity
MKKKLLKGAGIGLGALVLSTLGLFASDTLRGINSGIDNLASLGGSEICGKHTVPVKIDGNIICVDAYEASPSDDCLFKEFSNVGETERNIETKGCFAVSQPDVSPWNYVSLSQAQRMCAEAGKRLPTSNEWYSYTLGTKTESCVVDESSFESTGSSECTSSVGVSDAVGNLWEWVDESVVEGTFKGQLLPEEGYVASVDADGIALTSSGSPGELYGDDYFWSKQDGVYGMVRGGFYGSGEDAGLYITNASVQTSLATIGVGFRCVEDIF